ncbi:Uncharacterized MFS-type transporter ycaD [Legionella spiritensis]|nr:Uncharacterized MFS-type transporter ycaD [Legionella spiritensis]
MIEADFFIPQNLIYCARNIINCCCHLFHKFGIICPLTFAAHFQVRANMLAYIRITFIPLLSLFIFLLGAGFFSTLLALKMTTNHASTMMIGSMTGVFYAGLVLGSLRVDRFILYLGHIRAYVLFSFLLAVTCLLHGIFYNLELWLFLRFVGGFATAGLFVVIESWLLSVSVPENRGQVLSLYMISLYGAQSFGQFFLNIGDPQTRLLFILASILCLLSVIPLYVTWVVPPKYDEPSTLRLGTIMRQSKAGLLGALSSGMIMGSIYGLMPTYLTHISGSKADVAKYMFAIIFGGMLLQYPIGKLSDRMARRLVLMLICLATVTTCLAVMAIHNTASPVFFFLMILLGGLTFTLYPVSVSYACDFLDRRDIVVGTQGLLLAYSIGAMIGPFIAPMFMQALGHTGLFIYFCAVSILVMPFFIPRRILPKTSLDNDERSALQEAS